MAALIVLLGALPLGAQQEQETPIPVTKTDSASTGEIVTNPMLGGGKWSKAIRGKARIKLWAWENEERLARLVEFNIFGFKKLSPVPDFKALMKSQDPYGIPGYDFRANPMYQIQYAQHIIAREQGRPSNVIMVSPLAVIPLLYQAIKHSGIGFLKSEKPRFREIYLSDLEINMMSILWRQPDITAVDWYRMYNRLYDSRGFNFVNFRQYIASLKNKGIIRSRDTESYGPRYSAMIDRFSLLYKLNREFDTSDILSKPMRHRQLIRMRNELRNRSLAPINAQP